MDDLNQDLAIMAQIKMSSGVQVDSIASHLVTESNTTRQDGQETPTANMQAQLQNQNISMIDPFERVLLLKNIDNAILTSYRTLTKQNNVVSQTNKIVHNKFTPIHMSKHVKKLYKKDP